MNQNYRFRFDQMRESHPTDSEVGVDANEAIYAESGPTRNVCFVWPDGKKAFFNYAYLISSNFDPNAERNQIRLTFSSSNVILDGYNLERLFMDFFQHLPRIVIATDARYASQADRQSAIILMITISQNEQ